MPMDMRYGMYHERSSYWKGLSVIRKYLAAVAATALVAAPVAAAPAKSTAGLSAAKSVRTGSASSKKSELAGGGGIIIAVLAVVAVGAGIWAVADSDDKADSN